MIFKKIITNFTLFTLFVFFPFSVVWGKSNLPSCKGDNPKLWSNCFGKYQNPQGDVYSGEWKNGAMHGNGELLTKDKVRYVGQFKMDTIEGMGSLYDRNGNLYFKGQFIKNKPTKNGTYYKSSGQSQAQKSNNTSSQNHDAKIKKIFEIAKTDNDNFISSILISFRGSWQQQHRACTLKEYISGQFQDRIPYYGYLIANRNMIDENGFAKIRSDHKYFDELKFNFTFRTFNTSNAKGILTFTEVFNTAEEMLIKSQDELKRHYSNNFYVSNSYLPDLKSINCNLFVGKPSDIAKVVNLLNRNFKINKFYIGKIETVENLKKTFYKKYNYNPDVANFKQEFNIQNWQMERLKKFNVTTKEAYLQTIEEMKKINYSEKYDFFSIHDFLKDRKWAESKKISVIAQRDSRLKKEKEEKERLAKLKAKRDAYRANKVYQSNITCVGQDAQRKADEFARMYTSGQNIHYINAHFQAQRTCSLNRIKFKGKDVYEANAYAGSGTRMQVLIFKNNPQMAVLVHLNDWETRF